MPPRIRLAILGGVALAIAVAAPLLVLDATGFRIDIHAHQLVRVGAIAIDVSPLGTHAELIDGEKKQATILNRRIFFPNLLPKTYVLRLTKDGFTPWEKQGVTVEANRTTFFPFAVLFPASFAQQSLVLPFSPTHVIPNETGDNVLIADATRVSIVDLVHNTSSAPLTVAIQNAAWFSDERWVLLSLLNGTLATVNTTASSLQALPLPHELHKGLPDPRGGGIFALRPGATPSSPISGQPVQEIVRFDLESGRTQSLSPRVFARAFTVTNEQLWFIDTEGIAWKSGLDGGGREQLTITALTATPLKVLAALHKTGFAVKDTQGDLWLWDADKRLFDRIAQGVKDFSFTESGEKLLVILQNEVHVRFLKEYASQPVRAKNEEDTITRVEHAVGNAFFYPSDEEHVVVNTPDETRIYELDGRGGRNSAPVVTKSSTAAALSLRSRKLFLATAGTLFTIDLPNTQSLQFGPIGF